MAVKLEASIALLPSANLHNTEFAAKASKSLMLSEPNPFATKEQEHLLNERRFPAWSGIFTVVEFLIENSDSAGMAFFQMAACMCA